MNEREQVLKFLYETVTNTNMPIDARLEAADLYLHHTSFPYQVSYTTPDTLRNPQPWSSGEFPSVTCDAR